MPTYRQGQTASASIKKRLMHYWHLTKIVLMILVSGWHMPVDAIDDCNPLKLNNCVMPFPSDLFTIPDESSPTGLRVTVSDDIFPEEIRPLVVDAFRPSTVFRDLTGFSAAAPVLFELDDTFDPDTLPKDGGDAFIIFDMTSGKRVPIVTYLSMPASSQLLAEPTVVIEGAPRSRFTYGSQYVAVLTTHLKRYDGQDFIKSTGVNAALANDNSELSSVMEPYIEYLIDQGIARDDILSLTHFTIRDEESVTSPLLEAVDTVRSQSHPIHISRVTYPWFSSYGAIVTGKVLATNFRAEDGSVDFDTGDEGVDNWISFRLTLPKQAKKSSVPIMVYGHGLSVLKETDFIVAGTNARHGIATISINHPNHGDRGRSDGGYLLFLMNPKNPGRLTGMITQSTLDFHSLLTAITTELNTLDVLPNQRSWFQRRLYKEGIGVADIDTDRIYYAGTSLGGMLGSTFVATAPEIKGAYLQVAGVGISNILTHSSVFDMMGFSRLVPPQANGSQSAFGLNMMQYRVDKIDGINYAHYLKDPPPHHLLREKPVTIQYGVDDRVVFNESTYAFAEILDMPLVGHHKHEIPFLRKTDSRENGSGIHEVVQPIPGNGFSAHMSFFTPVAYHIYKGWLNEVIYGN